MNRLPVLTIVGLLILAGILVAGVKFGYDHLFIDSDSYSAVLLSTGDVYFGKVAGTNGGYVKLNDVYYPQLVQGDQSQQGVRLVEFGTEFHGPAGTMKINRDHIIMIQPLRSDSQVIQTIEDYEAGQ